MQFGFPENPPLSLYFDKLQATGSGVTQFKDELGSQRSVFNVAERAEYRAITSSVSFAGLSENLSFSTQLRLMDRMVSCLLAEDDVPPERVTGVAAQKTSDSIILSWDDVDEDAFGGEESLDCYRIERSTSPFGRRRPIAFTLEPTYEDEPAGFGNPDTNYFYYIHAVDTTGNSGDAGLAAEMDYQMEDGE